MEQDETQQETDVEITSATQNEDNEDNNEKEVTETNPDGELSELEKKKKKLCVCSKIKHGNPEEHEIDCEECQDLPEASVESTPVVVETPPEMTEPEEDPENFDVVVVDPNQKVDTADIGVATDANDFPDSDKLLQENNELRSKLSSLSRENLQMDFKETQTDFPEEEPEEEEDKVTENETEAMRLMMERVKKRIEQEQQSQVDVSNVVGGPPMNLEFEILLDFVKDPKDPSKTMIHSSTIIKNPNDTQKSDVDQSMALSIENGESETPIPEDVDQKESQTDMEQVKEINDTDHNQNDNDGDDEDEDSTMTTTEEDTTTKVEVRDVATSMTEDFFDELSIPDESLQDLSLPYEKCIQTEAYTEVIYNDENISCKQEDEVEYEEQEKSKHGHKHYWVPNRSVFKELDSLVRGISLVYSDFEEAIKRNGFPGTI